MKASFQPVDSLMNAAVTDGVFPGGVLLVSREGTVLLHRAYGVSKGKGGHAVGRQTVFDLASLTKPLATVPALMAMVQAGRIDLDAELGELIPAFAATGPAEVKIRHLLDHSAGLAAYRPYFQRLFMLPPGWRKNALRRLLCQEDLLSVPGEKTKYSDLGFMILEWIVEEITGDRLDRYVREKFYQPLGLRNLFFVDLAAPPPPADFAATEQCPWRERLLEGEVHDENAWVAGGIQGHAGLFGTAADVHGLLRALLSGYRGQGDFCGVSPAWVQRFLQRTGPGMRTLGFDTPAAENSSCGRHFSMNTVGHLGYTGTSFWMDLDAGVLVILLTNRVHPSRENEKIRAFRPKIHDAIMETLPVNG